MISKAGPAAANYYQLEAIIADLSTGIIIQTPEGTLTYANQAALELHRVASLGELGRSSAEYQHNFRLCDLQDVPLPASAYPLERLLGGNTFDDLMLKVFIADEWRVHQCRSISVRDPGGNPEFYALIIEDESERYDAEQRFERTFTANPGASLISRLSDLRYIKVNRAFLEMTGFKREEIIGRTAYEFDVLSGVEA